MQPMNTYNGLAVEENI